MFCEKCGTELNETASVCESCGYSMPDKQVEPVSCDVSGEQAKPQPAERKTETVRQAENYPKTEPAGGIRHGNIAANNTVKVPKGLVWAVWLIVVLLVWGLIDSHRAKVKSDAHINLSRNLLDKNFAWSCDGAVYKWDKRENELKKSALLLQRKGRLEIDKKRVGEWSVTDGLLRLKMKNNMKNKSEVFFGMNSHTNSLEELDKLSGEFRYSIDNNGNLIFGDFFCTPQK